MADDLAASAINTVTWWEIPVRDLKVAQTFYGGVFGWTFQPFGDEYVGVLSDAAMIGGLSTAGAEEVGEGVRIYVNVSDIEATLDSVQAHGGAVKTPRQEVGGDMGWWANFSDDQGRLIGLCSMLPAS